MTQKISSVMQEKKMHRHIEAQHLLSKAIEIFAAVNKIDSNDLYTGTRKRAVVEARSMIWKYAKERTHLTYMELGERFNMSHCTVQHHINNHNTYLETVNKRSEARVNELYAITYSNGKNILNHFFDIPNESDMSGMKWRVVLMVDSYPDWSNFKVIEKERVL